MFRQGRVRGVKPTDRCPSECGVRELLIQGLEFELGFVATVERARNYSRLCFAYKRIFYVTNRLRAIRPILKAVAHDLVGHGGCGGGNVVCRAAPQQARAKASAIFLLPKSVEPSVAAFAGGLKSEVSGAGATAICTAASKRSYSSSLIALSFESSGRFACLVASQFPTTTDGSFGLGMSLFNRGEAAKSIAFSTKWLTPPAPATC